MKQHIDYLQSIRFFLIFLLAGFSFSTVGQTCKNNIVASTPTTDFILLNDGTAQHLTSGLVWARCAWGQQWDGQSCIGAATKHNWPNSLIVAQIANTENYLGYTDWRVPNIKELASIEETRCFDPSINAEVFPNTPSVYFWSTSVGLIKESSFARSVDFLRGGDTFRSNKGDEKSVRLVRGGQ